MSIPADTTILEVKGLNKHFGTVQAVRDLDFSIKKGEIFGFLGPNGAGKTTTMRIVTSFIPPTSGSIHICGLNLRENDLEIRKRLGYLPENAPLYYDMQVLEYLNFVGKLRGLANGNLANRIDEMIQVCGLGKMKRRLIGTLSKGFRQRVGLAQAMIHDPDLLILDEPMSGLDPNQIIEIRKLIKRLGSEKTVIYCSHILSEVSATCTRILIINNGSAVATGTPDELTSQGATEARYTMRVKADKDTVEKTIHGVNGVSSVAIRSIDATWSEAQVTSAQSRDIGEALFQCVVDNNWKLSELHRETASLEEVFSQLTRG